MRRPGGSRCFPTLRLGVAGAQCLRWVGVRDVPFLMSSARVGLWKKAATRPGKRRGMALPFRVTLCLCAFAQALLL